jgi:anti-sigma regulatory factor (Ser/Thr protein kinase)
MVDGVPVVRGVPLSLPVAVAPLPARARPWTSAEIRFRGRRLELLLVVRRSERDGVVAVAAQRPGRWGVSVCVHDDAADDMGSGREDSRYVQQEQTPIPIQETAMNSVEEVGLTDRCEPWTGSADSALRSGSSADGRRCQWHLRSVETAIPWLRRGLRGFLEGTDLPQNDLDDLILAACEAATNAVDHAQEPTEPFFDASIEIADGVVTVVIRDHGQWQQPTSDPYRGRGLEMMNILADTIVTPGANGTTVTIRNHHAVIEGLAEEGRAS